jgi:hypothetical protein
VLLSNSCKRAVRGSVNGLATSGASFARGIGPMLGATLFAWSESNGTKCQLVVQPNSVLF